MDKMGDDFWGKLVERVAPATTGLPELSNSTSQPSSDNPVPPMNVLQSSQEESSRLGDSDPAPPVASNQARAPVCSTPFGRRSMNEPTEVSTR